MKCLGIIPSCFSSDEKASDDELLDFFHADIDYPSVARSELQIWRSSFVGKELPDSAQLALKHAPALLFPHTYKENVNTYNGDASDFL